MQLGVGLEDQDTILSTIENLRERNELHGLCSHAPDESFNTLRRLKEENYKLGIISNADGRLAQALGEVGLDDWILRAEVELTLRDGLKQSRGGFVGLREGVQDVSVGDLRG